MKVTAAQGERVKTLRQAREMGMAELGRALGERGNRAVVMVCQIERGNAILAASTVAKLAAALGTTAEALRAA